MGKVGRISAHLPPCIINKEHAEKEAARVSGLPFYKDKPIFVLREEATCNLKPDKYHISERENTWMWTISKFINGEKQK